MGKDDWIIKDKRGDTIEEKGFTAEDLFWWLYNEVPSHPFCYCLTFSFEGIVYRIYEWCEACSFQLEALTCEPEEEEQYEIQSKKYDDWEELLYDPCWNGRSLGEMMQQLPEKELQ
ncbi:MAG: hypothetical protein Q4D38_07875 [Planctomycetia bacterium]|nr:hypothetical protein [Planctomycetia bacterium]